VDNRFYKPRCAVLVHGSLSTLLVPLNRSRAARPLLTPLAAALLTLWGGAACAQTVDRDEPIELRPTPALQPPPRGEAGRKLPIILRANSVTGRPDLDTVAEGNAELRRGGTVIRADRLSYEQPDDLAVAKGSVRISRDGNVYTGPELQLHVQRFEGYFLQPTFRFGQTGAGGTAARIDFIDDQRAVATDTTYTSCPADGSGGPAWLLTSDKVSFDFATNTGVAEGGVLRFLGVPILGAPRMSFPLTDARKSGWLPPSFGLDTKSGLQTSIPYYWNIAPNRDATFTPGISTRRGPSLGSEFRYLEPSYNGEVRLDLLPYDRTTSTTRYAFGGAHDNDFGNELLFKARWLRVSDNDYWKDFPADVTSLTPRLLATDFNLTRPWGDWTTYLRMQRWQVLQTDDPVTRIEAPYERVPQLGARYAGKAWAGLEIGFEGEFNRFANPTDPSVSYATRVTGSRLHAIGSISRPYVTPGWTLTPKVTFNAASYSLDNTVGTAYADRTRVIPTVSLDSAWVFERDTRFFGRSVRQTLEPRLLYVNTPYKDQSGLPNFDASAKDFNFDSIFTDNAFNGVDRVSDAHQVTAGVTSRFLDPDSGAELLRLGAAQRYLLRDQLVTPDGAPLTQRLSDLLLLGSTTLIPAWKLEGSVQYSPDNSRVTRSVVSARYSPGPFRTVSATYRLTRGLSEQVELGWQWPIYGPTPLERKPRDSSSSGGDCRGSWYGVGRINYSMLERRLTDAIVGVEYDAGCWIGRIVASRQSTGLSEATTRLLLQLELVGLSKLGTNPLQVLKDNIPGYRLLREGRTEPPASSLYD